jgi:hypothetical protein
MIVDTITFRKVIDWINQLWAKSLVAILMLFVGMWIGQINAEGRITSDCKFAGSFRVDIQAFTCQRKI